MKNSAKRKLVSFNAISVFPHDAMGLENDVIEAGSAGDVFVWLT